MQAGRTPLSIAVVMSHKEVVEVLIPHGADVNTSDKVREPMRPLLCSLPVLLLRSPPVVWNYGRGEGRLRQTI